MASNSFEFHNQPAGLEAYHNTLVLRDFSWESDAVWHDARIDDDAVSLPGETSDAGAGGAPFTIRREGTQYGMTWSAPSSGGLVEP